MNGRRINRLPDRRGQQGVALFVGLVMLLILTVLTLTTARSTLMQERIAGNVREANLAFQGAENVLRQVERQVRLAVRSQTSVPALETWEATGLPVFDCAGAGLPLSVTNAAPIGTETVTVDGETLTMSKDGTFRVVNLSNLAGSASPCKPFEEERGVGAGGRSAYYLIFARATGPAGLAESTVTSTYYYED